MRRIALVWLAPLLVTAEEPDPFFLEKVLPENTLLYVSIPNSAAASEDFHKSDLHRLIHHPEVKSFLEPLERYVEKQKTQGERSWNETVREATGLTIDEIWALAQGPVSLAVLDVPFNEDHPLDVVLSVGHPDPAKLKDAAAKVTGVVQRESESESSFQGVTIRSFGTRELTIHYAVFGKTYVFTTQEARMHQIISASLDKASATLEKSAAFRAARERVSPQGRHFFLGYLNTPAALKAFRKEIGDEALAALDELGAGDLTSLAAGLSFEGPAIRERYWIGTSGQTRGLPRLLAGKPSPDPAAKFVPTGAVAYGRLPLDPRALFDLTRAALGVEPKTRDEFDQTLQEYETRVGFKIRDDLLASLGSEWTEFDTLPEEGGLVPDSIYVTAPRDAAKFQDCLRKIAKDLKTEIVESEFQGHKFFAASFAIPGFARESGDPLRYGPVPSIPLVWCIRDGFLFLSSSPHAIKRSLAYSGKTLADDPKILEARRKIPGSDAEFFVDFGRLFLCGYNTVEPFLHFAREFVRDKSGEFILDLARLPLGETLADLIGTCYTAKRTEAAGITVESLSGVGVTPVTLTAVVGLGTGAFLLAQRRPPGGVAENERVAQTRLKWIVQAQATFRQSDSDGNLHADYWTRDVAGLYALKNTSGQAVYLIDPQTAQADPLGADTYDALRGTAQPASGYYFRALVTDPDGEPYAQDPDKDGNSWTNPNRFAVCGVPSAYGATGRMTFLVSEEGVVYKKDTRGEPIDSWPADPAKEGWTPVE